MTERRETGRSPRGKRPPKSSPKDTAPIANWEDGERIAKFLASAGVCSRRDAEKLIETGQVSVDGEVLTTPAFKVTGEETITVNGERVGKPKATRLWRYHKPTGLVSTNRDPDGRPTLFDALPPGLPRVVTIGRLDLNTEGLLLLTNDGELARALELPATGLKRRYKARAYGRITQPELDKLRDGIVYEGVEYRSIIATLDRAVGANNWINMTLVEGKKREARRALESLGMKVNRLIRVSYGPFELGDLQSGAAAEVPAGELLAEFYDYIPASRRPNSGRAPTSYPIDAGGDAAKTVGARGKSTKLKSSKRKTAKTRRGDAAKPRSGPKRGGR